eukprot:1153013-Pelagomonas_calceolata.AAC.2
MQIKRSRMLEQGTLQSHTLIVRSQACQEPNIEANHSLTQALTLTLDAARSVGHSTPSHVEFLQSCTRWHTWYELGFIVDKCLAGLGDGTVTHDNGIWFLEAEIVQALCEIVQALGEIKGEIVQALGPASRCAHVQILPGQFCAHHENITTMIAHT